MIIVHFTANAYFGLVHKHCNSSGAFSFLSLLFGNFEAVCLSPDIVTFQTSLVSVETRVHSQQPTMAGEMDEYMAKIFPTGKGGNDEGKKAPDAATAAAPPPPPHNSDAAMMVS